MERHIRVQGLSWAFLSQKLGWIFRWHAYRGHVITWFSCGTWLTSLECQTCNRRWEA